MSQNSQDETLQKTSESKSPRPIKKLSPEVIARIAAGEVIQRPTNALKELLENSLDAGATNIIILVKQGGLKLLQITDNGHGIAEEDLKLLCTRFTTSKLTSFDDLLTIGTFGFRGEALSSMSMCSKVTITSKTDNQDCAYRAEYIDGKLKPGTQPKPCAGVTGTQIKLEDMFYNNKIRKTALGKNPNGEFKRMLEMVQKYAINNPGVSITLRKADESQAAMHTSNRNKILDNIRILYGKNLSKELIEINHSNERLEYKVHGYVTNPNYNLQKQCYIIFINKRLVEVKSITKGLESVYAPYLPKHTHPWVYLHLEMNPKNLDVNVHPTKQEVHFLREDDIVEDIQAVVNKSLQSCNSSRVFYAQAAQSLPSAHAAFKSVSKSSTAPYNKVRTDDETDQTGQMENYLTSSSKKRPAPFQEYIPIKKQKLDNGPRLTSIVELSSEYKEDAHPGLTEVMRHHTYVGFVNPSLSLIQYRTKLYIVNAYEISVKLLYQIVIENFSNFKKIRLSEPADIYTLILTALQVDNIDNAKQQAKEITELLAEKAEMIDEYFSIEIKDGKLLALPLLLNNHVPPLHRLPDFLYRLGRMVDWEEEKNCFQTLATELSLFYALSKEYELKKSDSLDNSMNSLVTGYTKENLKWITRHVLFPAAKLMLEVPKEFAEDGTIVEVANIANLYKVFERC